MQYYDPIFLIIQEMLEIDRKEFFYYTKEIIHQNYQKHEDY